MEIPIHSRKGIIGYALIDDADHPLIKQYRWSKTVRGYAQSWDKNLHKMIYMHRIIMGLKHGEKAEIDHINHNPLDNRRSNLRFADRTIQNRNLQDAQINSTTGHLNVHRLPNGYQVRIFGQYYGFRKTLEEAAELAKTVRAAILDEN